MDNINHPSHYKQSAFECIDVLKDLLGPEGFKAFCRGNCIKYLWRFEHKNGLEDLKKANWYLSALISLCEAESN